MTKWTDEEKRDAQTMGWASFRAAHPARSYDSFEVKRRRLVGGTAGKGRRPKMRTTRPHVLTATCGCVVLMMHCEVHA